MAFILIIPRIFSVILCVLFLSLNVLEAMISVKGCDSLGSFDAMHRTIAARSLAAQSELLSGKVATIDKLDVALFETIKGIREEVLSNEASLLKLKQPYMSFPAPPIPEKTITSSILQLNKKLENIYAELKALGVDISGVKTSDLPVTLREYKHKFIENMTNRISKGDYSALLSSLPGSFFIEAHVPNTFTCAFTLVPGDSAPIDIFVKNAGKNLIATQNPMESCVFTSGDGEEDFFKSSLLLQSRALGGSISTAKMKPVSNTPSDLYRHSEQRSFSQLGVLEFVTSVIGITKGPIKEIIFHGNTLRDMCSNCRATLIAHEMLATKNALIPGTESFDSFLCALQEAFFTKFNVRPAVKCVISSFVEYEDRTKDYSWSLEPFVNPLDFSVKAPKGICANFVNQFAFSERDFLNILIPELKSKATLRDTAEAIITSLCERVTTLK